MLVDGRSQALGDGSAGRLVTKDGVTYQAGESSLYRGVTHRRMVMMLDPSHVLVVDRLTSKSVHSYQQMFHLFPGAKLVKHGLTVSGIGGSPRREVTIQQLLPGGIQESDVINQRGDNPDGVCSEHYGQLLPCYAISYSARGRDATFMTMLTVGATHRQGWGTKVAEDGKELDVADGPRHLSLSLGQSAAIKSVVGATDPTPPTVKTIPVPAFDAEQDWTSQGSGVAASNGSPGSRLPAGTVARVSTNIDSPIYLTNNSVSLDLLHRNARFRLRIQGLAHADDLTLQLSNDHWHKYVSMALPDAYTRDYADQWVDLFIGPSGQWGPHGGWVSSTPGSPGFDWAHVDGVRVEVSSHPSRSGPLTLSIGRLSLLPAQKEGKVVFVFDDGYQSILPAAQYMHQKGMAGDVAVIGHDVDVPTLDSLNVFQLKALQNNWGWDIANHTQDHVDAVQTYYAQHYLSGYRADVLQQALWLEANHLNSAPNWLIYPHGAINETLERVISHYYMFARVTADNPDAWPYGDPHAISDLEIQYPGDGEGGDVGFTPPSHILSTVRDAMSHHMTVILTFHRIHSQPSDPPGYPLALFKRVVDGIASSGIKVMTLSELDRSNGVPVRNHIYMSSGRASQITVSIGTQGH